jgi:hypothetical protein
MGSPVERKSSRIADHLSADLPNRRFVCASTENLPAPNTRNNQRPIEVGAAAPDTALRDLDGNDVTLHASIVAAKLFLFMPIQLQTADEKCRSTSRSNSRRYHF